MLDIVGSNEGAQGPSSDQRVSAMQLFWLHSCCWPPGNAATTGSSSKAEVSRLSKNPRGPQLSLLGLWVAPWGILGNDPAQSPQPALLCRGSPGHFQNKADVFWRQLCLLFCCLLSRLWGYSGLSPKLLAGMLNFGNGLKAELKEEFLISVVDSGWAGKANQLEEEERWVPPILRDWGCRKRMRRGLTVQHGLAGQ